MILSFSVQYLVLLYINCITRKEIYNKKYFTPQKNAIINYKTLNNEINKCNIYINLKETHY